METIILKITVPKGCAIQTHQIPLINEFGNRQYSEKVEITNRPTDEDIAISSSYLADGEYKNGYETGYYAALNKIFGNPQGGGTK